MKHHIMMFILGFIAALALVALSGAAQANHAPGCPDTINRGRELKSETHSARWSECLYGRPQQTVCGSNVMGWPGEVLRRPGRKVVCLYVEPLIPEINGGAGQ